MYNYASSKINFYGSTFVEQMAYHDGVCECRVGCGYDGIDAIFINEHCVISPKYPGFAIFNNFSDHVRPTRRKYIMYVIIYFLRHCSHGLRTYTEKHIDPTT